VAKRFKLCILHIGTEKTGSSSIQVFSARNRKALLKEGILYLDTGTMGSQWEFVALAHTSPWRMDTGQQLNITDEASQKAFKKSFLQDFEIQISAADKASTLLISSEHFHSRLNTLDMVKSLKAVLDPYVEAYKIVVYFRRQDELAISHFTTRVKSGFQGKELDLPTEKFPSQYYDYGKLAARWSEVFGLDAIQSELYHEASKGENGILNNFSKICNINLIGKYIPRRYNHSVSAEGLRFIQSINHIYNTHDGLLSAQERHDLIAFSSTQNPGKFYPISKTQAEIFQAQYININTTLAKALFPDRTQPLFNDDFSQYPETADILPDTYDDAVLQAIKIWKKPEKKEGLRGFAKKTRDYFKDKI